MDPGWSVGREPVEKTEKNTLVVYENNKEWCPECQSYSVAVLVEFDSPQQPSLTALVQCFGCFHTWLCQDSDTDLPARVPAWKRAKETP